MYRFFYALWSHISERSAIIAAITDEKGGGKMRTALSKRAALIIVILLFVVAGNRATAQVPEHVPWDADHPITWSLFIAPYPQDGCLQAEAAAIHMTINWSVSYVLDYDRAHGNWYGYIDAISVINTMEPRLSWAAAQGKSADVLSHEQRHFDLNEVYACKLKVLLTRPRVTGETKDAVRIALRKEINATAALVLDTASQLQSRYDDETAHGTNAAVQASWAVKIDTWLANPLQAP